RAERPSATPATPWSTSPTRAAAPTTSASSLCTSTPEPRCRLRRRASGRRAAMREEELLDLAAIEGRLDHGGNVERRFEGARLLDFHVRRRMGRHEEL